MYRLSSDPTYAGHFQGVVVVHQIEAASLCFWSGEEEGKRHRCRKNIWEAVVTEKPEQQSARENDDNEENAEEALLQTEELDLAEESDDDEIVLADVCADSQLEAYENMMPEQQDIAETTGTVTVDDVLGPSTHADTQDCPTQRLAICI